MVVVDKLCYRSKLRYVNATEKTAFALTSLLLTIVSRSIPTALVVLAVNSYLTLAKGKIPVKPYRKLMLIPLSFLLLSTLAILFKVSHTPMNAYAIPVGSWYITNDWDQVLYGIQLILTALSSVSCLYFLSLNTTMTDILIEFRRMHCPALMVELMMLMYRYIFVLMDVADNIKKSQNSRLGNKDYKTSLHSFGVMISVLFVRAIKKAQAQFNGLESRGYDGEIRVLSEHYPPKTKEIVMIVVYEAALLVFVIYQFVRPIM